MVESLRRSRKLKTKKGRDYEDSTLQALSRSRERPELPIRQDSADLKQFAQAPVTQPAFTDDDITDDFSQIRTSDHSETYAASEPDFMSNVVPPAIERSRPKNKYTDKFGKGKFASRPVSSEPEAGAYTQVCRPLSRDRALGLLDTRDSRSLERGTLANTSLQAHSPLMRRMFSDEYIRRAMEDEARMEKFDAYAQAKSSRRNSSFKNHRTQAGFPGINKTVRAVSVQIGTMDTDASLGPSIVEVEKPFTLCNDGSSHFIQDEEPALFESTPAAKAFAAPQFSARLDDDDSINTEKIEAARVPRMKRRAKRIQCGTSCVEKQNYSTAFQIGPRTADTAVEAQHDLLVNYLSQYKSPGQGKKMQVGETLEEFRRGQKTSKLNYNQDDVNMIPEMEPYPLRMTERSNMVYQTPYSMAEGRLPMPMKGKACSRCGRYTPEARSKRIQKGASQVLFNQTDEAGESACASSPMIAMIRRTKMKGAAKHRARSASNIHIHIRIADSDDSWDEEDDFCVSCESKDERKIFVHVDGDREKKNRQPRSKRSQSCDDFYGIWESIERSGDIHDKRLAKLVDRIGFRGVEERLAKMKQMKNE
ncbi:hypothetical protein Ciccas_006476 [Cichlidogyrus casuarinus]|uniref:Uncharacterized protein n=1 Tax=Cichlidogyrus casuarinus TaxID=1844966 RepID=A0ABD2Q662_9PLAT